MQIFVETANGDCITLEELVRRTRQNYWEFLSFRISNNLQV